MKTASYLFLIFFPISLFALGFFFAGAVAILKPFKRTYADSPTETDRQLTHREMKELCCSGNIIPARSIIRLTYLSGDSYERI